MGVTEAMVAVVGGGGQDFSVSDHPRMVVSFGFPWWLSESTLVCAMSFFTTSEAKSLSDVVGMIGRGELFQVNGIHIHGIRVSGGVQVGGKGGEG